MFGTRLFFGWAKPVPVQWWRLRPLRPGIALVALAGPVANLLQLVTWLALELALRASAAPPALIYLCEAGIMFNAAIMTINLIPIPPLDGSRVLTALLPPRWAARYNRYEQLGLVLIALLIASGGAGCILGPLLRALVTWLNALGL